MDSHLSGKLAQGFVEVVHLGQDADCGQNHEDISRWVAELIAPGKRKLQRNAKRLDRHDGDGADGRANGQVD